MRRGLLWRTENAEEQVGVIVSSLLDDCVPVGVELLRKASGSATSLLLGRGRTAHRVTALNIAVIIVSTGTTTTILHAVKDT